MLFLEAQFPQVLTDNQSRDSSQTPYLGTAWNNLFDWWAWKPELRQVVFALFLCAFLLNKHNNQTLNQLIINYENKFTKIEKGV